MMTEERFKETNYKMSYEEYKKCVSNGDAFLDDIRSY